MDVFNQQIDTRTSGSIASSEFAKVTLNGGSAGSLMQQVSIQYQQQIERVTELGGTHIYWIPGKPEGTMQVSRVVGDGGFFEGWSSGKCGIMESMGVNVKGGRCGFNGSGGLLFENGVANQFSADIATERYTIRESMTVRFGKLSRKN